MDKCKGSELEIPYRPLPPPLPYGFHDGDLPPLDPEIFDQHENEPIEIGHSKQYEPGHRERQDRPADKQCEIHMPIPQKPVGRTAILAKLDDLQVPIHQSQSDLSETTLDFNIVDELIEEYFRMVGDQCLSPQSLCFDDLFSSDPVGMSIEDGTNEQSRFYQPLDLGVFDLESRIADIPWPPTVIRMEHFGWKAGQPLAELSVHDKDLLRHYLDEHVPMREHLMAEGWRQQRKDRKILQAKGAEAENPIFIEDNGGKGKQPMRNLREDSVSMGQRRESSTMVEENDLNEKTSQALRKGKKSQNTDKEKKSSGVNKGKKPRAVGRAMKAQTVGKESILQVEPNEENSRIISKSGYHYADGSIFSP